MNEELLRRQSMLMDEKLCEMRDGIDAMARAEGRNVFHHICVVCVPIENGKASEAVLCSNTFQSRPAELAAIGRMLIETAISGDMVRLNPESLN